MKITRKFTTPDASPFDQIEWSRRTSRISNPDGSVVFEMEGVEVPASWSQLATDIMVSKYFRKAGVPTDGGPRGLRDAGYDHEAKTRGSFGPETSARQVIHRLAGCWRHWGEEHGYFDTADDARAFYDELVYMMLHQMAAPNSPQWFNTGLSWAYGISGPAQGHWYCDPQTGEVRESADAYSHPQPHACFIQEVDDDLVNSGGIMDLWTREARLFKYGSGTGTNFSNLRASSEQLSGGGKSSGLMSWLKIGDRAAAAVKSGGTTRRAAKMVCLDMDHPDIKTFINWKVREEVKVAAMVEGLRLLKTTDESIRQTCERLGLELDYDFNGEAYATVSGQNSNNSVRIPDAFFDALDAPAGSDEARWTTTWRTTGEVARTFDARELWNDIGYAAWRCADPGVQFDSTINAWHTCPGAGRINASNPCSEYMFLDNTACNLASLNVVKFYDAQTRRFDVDAFEHAVDLWTMALEISVLMASFPSEQIARLSYRYRTLGLGFANLGALLMRTGMAYDSDEGRAIGATLSAILTGRSYAMSARLAERFGPFPGFAPEREAMLRVIRNHRRAAHGEGRESDAYEQLRIRPVPIDHGLVASGGLGITNAPRLGERAQQVWDEALVLGERHGYRNAQVSVIAPTGTIGLLMDCDTTGVEPDFALVKFKKLAGGGYFKIANASVEPALQALGYDESAISEIMIWLLGTLDLHVPMPAGAEDAQPGESFAQWLMGRGLNEDDLKTITDALPGVFSLAMAFGPWTLGDAALQRLGLDPQVARDDPSFDVLRALGLTGRQVDELNGVICGTQTVEGAPHLRDEHLAVFDCASTCGPSGTRLIRAQGHIRMMAAAQPFISGAISKTINLPNDATVEDITACYRLSWELGLKANALYRDGCKLSQPLNATSAASADETPDTADEPDDEPVAIRLDTPAEAEAIAQVFDARTGHSPQRHRLPDTRRSITHKFNIGGHEGYLTVGLYENGQPGELFITMAKEGSTIGGLMDSLGTATSVSLQYGVPLASLVKKFTHQRFEPAGMTTNRDIPFAKSLVDYIFRWLGMEFIPGYREANAPRRQTTPQPPAQSSEAAPRLDTAATDRVTPPDDEPARRVVQELAEEHTEVYIASTGSVVSVRSETLSAALDAAGDAPPCDVCGTITVRSGTCYKCLNCGNSMGCS